MRRRGDTHRMVRWLWTSRRPDARLARLALLPVSGLWRAVMAGRGLAYRRGWFPVHDLPLPTVAVGNLTVGGSGKTPIAIWVARHYQARGLRPGILLRGYGGDEALVHEHAVPGAVVIPDPDRVAGAERTPISGSMSAATSTWPSSAPKPHGRCVGRSRPDRGASRGRRSPGPTQ